MAKKIDIQLNIQTNGRGEIEGLAMDLQDFQRAVGVAAATSNKVVKEMNAKWYDSITRISATCATFGTSLQQLQTSLESLSVGYKSFDSAMRLANTMAGKDAAGFEHLKTQISDLSKEVPLTRDALANGLYEVISNGVPEDNWIEFLSQSAKAAVGGAADLGKVVGVTSTIIKNYGLSWDQALTIQNQIQLTAKNGVTSFEQLAQALPRVTGNAAELGLSIDELLATFATLTGVSGNTAEVSTQLAAVFTALIKPSSEATKMAAAMGIQFNAAAIKAAGGMQNFLQNLDVSVKKYSSASGILEKEVYGRLFGSAEALRALGPLQGELSEKFKANAAEMVNSAGAVDNAFKQNISSELSQIQLIKNKLSFVTDATGKLAAFIQPYLQYLALCNQAGAGIVTLSNALRVLAINSIAFRKLRNLAVAYTMSCEAGTKATFLLNIALKSLAGIGVIALAFMAASKAIKYFSNESEKARQKAEELKQAEENEREAAKHVEDTRRSNAENIERVRIQIEKYITKIKEFKGSKEEEKRLIGELNNAYGKYMKKFDSLAKWYNALQANSKAYCEQLSLEAEAQLLTDQIARKRMQIASITHNSDGSIRKYSKSPNAENLIPKNEADKLGIKYESWQVVIDKDDNTKVFVSDLDMANAKVKSLNTETSFLSNQLYSIVTKSANLKMPLLGEDTDDSGDGNVDDKDNDKNKQKQWIENARSLKDYQNNLAILDSQIQALDVSNVEEINRLKEKREELERNIASLKRLLGLTKESNVREYGEIVKPAQAVNPSAIPSPPIPDVSALELMAVAYEMATKHINDYADAAEAAAKRNELLRGAVSNIASGMSSLGRAIGGAAGAWLEYASKALSAIAQVLPQILELTNAQAGQAISGVTASAASLPPPFNIISIAAGVAAVIAALASVPKFADGGIAYGPTLGLFGEYAGASHNPEVVAPLSELSKLLRPAAPAAAGEITLRIKGRDLVGVYNLQNNYTSRI